MRIVFIVSIYPKLSEAFILQELYQLGKLGVEGFILAFKKGDRGKQQLFIKKINFRVLYFVQKVLQAKNYFRLFKLMIKYSFQNPRQFLRAGHWILKTKRLLVSNLRIFMKVLLALEKIEEFRPDVIVSHYGTEPTDAAIFLSFLLDIPFGTVLHTNDLFVRNRFLKVRLRMAQFVVVKSNFSRKYLVDNFSIGERKIWVIPTGGVDTRFFAPPASLKKKEKVKTIISVGRLVEKKGYQYLIQACSILKDEGIKFQCLIIGDGDLRMELERIVRKHRLRGRTKFLGALSHGVKFKKLLLSSDVFVLPSIVALNNDRDILANALLEAMALEVPVITTQISGIKELIINGKNGFLVPMKDSRALASKIKLMLAMKRQNRVKVGRQARQTITKKFDTEKVVRGMFNLVKAYKP